MVDVHTQESNKTSLTVNFQATAPPVYAQPDIPLAQATVVEETKYETAPVSAQAIQVRMEKKAK